MNIRYLLIAFPLLLTLSACFETSRQAPANIADKYRGKVVLYATSWCGYCEKTRDLFEQRNIQYIELDIESSLEGKTEFDQLGAKGIPLVLIKGRVVEGYAPNAVLNLYHEK